MKVLYGRSHAHGALKEGHWVADGQDFCCHCFLFIHHANTAICRSNIDTQYSRDRGDTSNRC
jgi:hypothetical protein